MDKFNVKNHTSGLFLIAALFFIFTYIISCTKQKNNSISNPELEIAKEINKRKIVMVGDNTHGHPSGYKKVINILNEWFKEVEINKNNPLRLNLFLEIEDSLAMEINNYIRTGNLSIILDRFLMSSRYEELEFYSKLKEFYNVSNQKLAKDSKKNFEFNVLGFEDVGNYVSSEYYKKTKYERQYWFIKERDSILAQKMINYINKNKNDRNLFFYGTAHLQKGLINKNYENILTSKDSCMGYCLANYFKNEYGYDNVLTIGGGMAPDGFYEKNRNLIDKSFYIKSTELEPYSPGISSIDYFYITPFINISDHSFRFVNCKKVFEKYLDKIKSIKGGIPGQFAEEFRKAYFRSLSYLTGKKFGNVYEFEKWFNNRKSFDIAYLDSDEFRDNFYKIFLENPNNITKGDLIKLGFDESILEYNAIKKSDWNNKIWPEALDNIKLINAIGILWAGYPDEKAKAKEFLVNFSKKDFAEPEKYLQWWRNSYHNYGIE